VTSPCFGAYTKSLTTALFCFVKGIKKGSQRGNNQNQKAITYRIFEVL
jgi:hypothetical protein